VGDIGLILLGAWLHQLARVVISLFRMRGMLEGCSARDRLAVVCLAREEWSSVLSPARQAELRQLRLWFLTQFYGLLILPMFLLILFARWAVVQ
jgi:hypothetical protein